MVETTTIYARVPTEVKGATVAYATERGMTLANAVSDLLHRGLDSQHSDIKGRLMAHDPMSNTAAQEAATRDVHLWAALVSLMSSMSSHTGIGYQALTVDPGRITGDEKVVAVTSRYMAPGGTVFEIEHIVSVNYKFKAITSEDPEDHECQHGTTCAGK